MFVVFYDYRTPNTIYTAKVQELY